MSCTPGTGNRSRAGPKAEVEPGPSKARSWTSVHLSSAVPSTQLHPEVCPGDGWVCLYGPFSTEEEMRHARVPGE